MKQELKTNFSLFGSVLATAVLGIILLNEFYSGILCFISLHILLITLIRLHVKRANSQRLYGIYLIAITLFYSAIRHTDRPSFRIDFQDGTFDTKFILWITIIMALIGIGLYAVIKGGRILPLKNNTLIIASMVLLFSYLITEVPLYQTYGGFGNTHGHAYWKTLHLH